MVYRNNKNSRQARDLLVSLFNCNPEDMDYLMYLINKAQNGHKEDILSSIMFGLTLDCASYNLRSFIDELFRELGNVILGNIIHGKMREEGCCEITLDGAEVKDKRYKFDLSIIESDDISYKAKQEIISEFNTFLEK